MISIRFPRAFRDKTRAMAHPKIHGPTIEEIQAAIRKVVSEDAALRTLMVDEYGFPFKVSKNAPAPKTSAPGRNEIVDEYGFVVERENNAPAPEADATALTEIVDEYGFVVKLDKTTPAPRAETPDRAEIVDEYGFVTTLENKTNTPAPVAESPPPSSAEPQIESQEALPSEESVAASLGFLAEFVSTISRQEVARAGAPVETPNRTLDGLIAEIVRPMLREWLDANLLGLIERMICREIETLTRRAA